MRYLLDTCVLSDFTRGEPNTLTHLKSTPTSQVAVSSVAAMEVEFGLALDRGRARRLGAIVQALLDTVAILPYDVEDARATAVLRAALQKRGRPIGAYDALIAGTALARGLVLVTSNESEFRRVAGLQVENWRKR